VPERAAPLAPGPCGHGAQPARGQGRVPSTRAGQLRGLAAAAERGAPAGQEVPEALLLDAHAACALAHEVSGHPESIEGLAQRFEIALGLFVLAVGAFLGVETPS